MKNRPHFRLVAGNAGDGIPWPAALYALATLALACPLMAIVESM